MSEQIEGFSSVEESSEGTSFMDTVKAYTKDLEAPVPPHQECSPAPSHTSSLLSVTQSADRSHSINASNERGKSGYLEDEQENSGLEDLSSTPSIPSTPSSTNDFWNPVPVSNASRRPTPKADSSQPLPTPSASTRKVGVPPSR